MSASESTSRIILAHAGREAFSDMSRSILSRLGYLIVRPEEFDDCAESLGRDRPDLRIVDERSIAEIPDDAYSTVPIIVLTGSHGVSGADPRIVGAIQRPAGMHELYRVIQEVLEDAPRSTPRLPVHLKAHCSRDGCDWTGAVLSLSEGGCLLRSTAPQNLGVTFTLRFSLPRTGPLVLDAEVTYQLVPDLGLTFQSTSPTDRESITNFIQRSLLDD
ncbi:MAG: PilZ domain-containing protein [Deltaproteobacteria bacterium]|nr:PilZ domain-containing protein [Deltaproteobacteria bacterium]MBW2664803.1 PilZ domain-containing protein [Deltaproteobacteria bacterium]